MIKGVPPVGHGVPDRKIARDLPALRGLPTEMKKQIRKPRPGRPGHPPGDRVDRRTGPVAGTDAGHLNRSHDRSAAQRRAPSRWCLL
jgi:hypothetical protein